MPKPTDIEVIKSILNDIIIKEHQRNWNYYNIIVCFI